MLSVKSRKTFSVTVILKTCLWLWSAWTWACVITEKGIFWVWQTKYIMFLAVWYKQHHVRHNEEKRFVPMLDQNAPCSWPQKRLMNLLHQITWWWSALCFFNLTKNMVNLKQQCHVFLDSLTFFHIFIFKQDVNSE